MSVHLMSGDVSLMSAFNGNLRHLERNVLIKERSMS